MQVEKEKGVYDGCMKNVYTQEGNQHALVDSNNMGQVLFGHARAYECTRSCQATYIHAGVWGHVYTHSAEVAEAGPESNDTFPILHYLPPKAVDVHVREPFRHIPHTTHHIHNTTNHTPHT